MERALDARPVVLAEGADARHDLLEVRLGDVTIQEHGLAARAEAGFRAAPEVHHDLDHIQLRAGVDGMGWVNGRMPA